MYYIVTKRTDYGKLYVTSQGHLDNDVWFTYNGSYHTKEEAIKECKEFLSVMPDFYSYEGVLPITITQKKKNCIFRELKRINKHC